MRFRPRFALRTIFVLIAIIGAFCAYHVHWIRARHALLAEHETRDKGIEDEERRAGGQNHDTINYNHRAAPKQAFNLLWLFGEPKRDYVILVFRIEPAAPDPVHPASLGERLSWNESSIPLDEVKLAESLFPEARIQYRLYGL